ncbi:MAG TPA: Kdo hydroxylase family protein [Blastocatellia bacterium]
MPVVQVSENGDSTWRADGVSPAGARWPAEQLEQGNILLFQRSPLNIPAEHLQYLLCQRQDNTRLHKNISYRPVEDVLRGAPQGADIGQLKTIVRGYSGLVTEFLTGFLAPYAGKWSLDFASFRPIEEDGRDLPHRKRNDLLHVDAFPTRPTKGARILRVFTNINPTAVRVWNTTGGFDKLAQGYAMDAGLGRIARGRSESGLGRMARGVLTGLGIRAADRSDYDAFMIKFHNYLKENAEFQRGCEKERIEFPPGCMWLVFTDAVAHAVLSGRFALEQTYIVPREALLRPESAPISVLEKLCGKRLA